MIDVPGGNGALPNRVMLAVSSGSTITSSSSFTFFYFQHDTTTGTAILPQPGRSPGNTLQLNFTRYADRTDLILTVQATVSLTGSWTDLAQSTAGAAFSVLVAGVTVAESGTGNARNVTVADADPVTDPAHPHRFMRLKVVNTAAN